MKIVVLDGFAVNPGDMSWDFLSRYGESTVHKKLEDSEIAKYAHDAEAIFTNRAKITAELLAELPRLKYVSALGTGYDMIDVPACRARGIEVCNVPAYSSDSVAQLTVTLLLNLVTDLNGLRKIVKDGKWTGIPDFHYEYVKFSELAGKTMGLVGCGNIGRRVAEICAAFGMNVVAHTRTKDFGRDGVVEYLPIDELLAASDAVSLHCPLCDETRGMVDKSFISKMKDGALLINTSRGAVLNEKDVAEALNAGKLGGAALDVLAKEPAAPDNPLLTAKNCIITPHSAWTTIEARRRLIDILDKNLGAFIHTGKGVNRVL